MNEVLNGLRVDDGASKRRLSKPCRPLLAPTQVFERATSHDIHGTNWSQRGPVVKQVDRSATRPRGGSDQMRRLLECRRFCELAISARSVVKLLRLNKERQPQARTHLNPQSEISTGGSFLLSCRLVYTNLTGGLFDHFNQQTFGDAFLSRCEPCTFRRIKESPSKS